MRFLFPYLARWRAANWTRYHQLLCELARQGHEVLIFEPPPRPSRETNYTDYDISLPPNMETREVAVPSWFWRRPLPLDKLIKKGVVAVVSYQSVARVVRQERVDALILYNIPQAPLVDLPCRVVFDVADDLVTMLTHEMGGLARFGPSQVARRLFQRMLDRADVVTTCSAGLRAEMGPKAVLVPNGVDRHEIAQADGAGLRPLFQSPIVGFLGAFEYFVDFDLVLDAATGLPDVTFLLVGGGRTWEGVKARVAARGLHNVVLPGPVPHNQALNYIAAMDITLIPFTRDRVSDFASPLKLFEYMALGKPVISTPGYEIEKIAGPYVTIIQDSRQLTEAIRQTLDGGEVARARAEAGRRLVDEHYTWDRIAQTFLTALKA